MRIMIAPNARGGIRSVVEAYHRDGVIAEAGFEVIFSYEEGGFLARQYIFFKAACRLVWLLSFRTVSLVHIHSAMRGSFWRKSILSLISRWYGARVFFHLHGSEMVSFYEEQGRWGRWLIARQLEGVDKVLVLSRSWEHYIRTIAPCSNICILPNYVEASPMESRDRKPDDAVVFLFLGLIGGRKGVFDLIEASSLVHHACPSAKILIGGNGDVERASFMIKKYGLEKVVQLKGWVDEIGREELFSQSHIYVLPSYNEGLPMSVLEAMGRGLAIITTTVGGIPELISDGVEGYLVKPGEVADLADKMIYLARNPVIRDEMARSARNKVAASYSKDAVLPTLFRLYDAVS